MNNEILYLLTETISVDMMVLSKLDKSKYNINRQLEAILPNYITTKHENIEEHISNKHLQSKREELIKQWRRESVFPNLPSFLWRTKVYQTIPSIAWYRRRMFRDIFDLKHYLTCERKEFHIHYKDDKNCVCINCGNHLKMWHDKDCNPFTIFPTYGVFSEANTNI